MIVIPKKYILWLGKNCRAKGLMQCSLVSTERKWPIWFLGEIADSQGNYVLESKGQPVKRKVRRRGWRNGSSVRCWPSSMGA